MSTRSQLTKDLNESVKSLLGKRVKILLKNVVRLETKGDKTENRVLLFSCPIGCVARLDVCDISDQYKEQKATLELIHLINTGNTKQH